MAGVTTEATAQASAQEPSTKPDRPPEVPALNPEEVAECLRAGRPIKELLDLDDSVWETMYDFGYRNFINAQYGLAEYWWTQTCLFDSAKDRNWVALGVACKRQKKYEQALNAFSLAVHNGGKNPWAPLHAAECHLHEDRPQAAASALEDAESWASNSDEQEVILKRVKMLRRGIQRRLEKETPGSEPTQDSTNRSS